VLPSRRWISLRLAYFDGGGLTTTDQCLLSSAMRYYRTWPNGDKRARHRGLQFAQDVSRLEIVSVMTG
jgi:hypothetical protein